MPVMRMMGLQPRPELSASVSTADRFVIGAWLLSSIAVPFVAFFAWPATYPFYVLIAAAAVAALLGRPAARGQISLLMVAKLALLLLSAFAHSSDNGSLINIFAAAVCDVCIMMLCFTVSSRPETVRLVLDRLRVAAWYILILGTIVSVVLARRTEMAIDDPIADFLAGERFKIISNHFGHSLAIDAGILFTIFALSNVLRQSWTSRIVHLLVGLACIYAAKSATGQIALAATIAIALVEVAIPSRLVKNIALIGTAALILTAAATDGDALLTSIRSIQQGGDLSAYRTGDLSAGRAALTSQLIATANSAPLLGVGSEAGILKDGIYSSGQTVALSESSFRIAVKYGWLYWCVILAIVLLPMRAIFSEDRSIRIFNFSLVAFIVTFGASNSIFEVAHTWQYYVYLPLIFVISRAPYIQRARASRGAVSATGIFASPTLRQV